MKQRDVKDTYVGHNMVFWQKYFVLIYYLFVLFLFFYLSFSYTSNGNDVIQCVPLGGDAGALGYRVRKIPLQPKKETAWLKKLTYFLWKTELISCDFFLPV